MDYSLGKNCTKDCTNQRKFDWDKSSTYKFTDNGDGMFIQFATGVGIDPVNKVRHVLLLLFFQPLMISDGPRLDHDHVGILRHCHHCWPDCSKCYFLSY